MTDIVNILADEATSILEHTCAGIPKSVIHAPGPDYIDRVVAHKNRKPAVLRNLNAFYNHGRLAGTGYMSLLLVDQGVEHSAGASGDDDLHQAVRTAVINKRAGGMGLISGRKAFQKPMEEGIALLNAIQDVYLSEEVTIA